MTAFQSTGLSINIEDPLIKSNRASYGQFFDQIQSYSQESRAIGGYWSSRIRINDKQGEIENWIDTGGATGLGRHIVTKNPALETVWEGFVNKITVTLGGFSYSLGPLINIGNRVTVIYSTVDTSTTPPTVGIRTKTATANDTDSQDLYGIIEKIISKGGATSTEAEQGRDTWLSEKANPETGTRDNVSGTSQPSVSLDCLGYWHWLKLYVYNETTSGDQNLSDKIIAVINAQLNSIFSTDMSKITSNTLQVPQYDNKDRKAESIIKQLNSLGDASDNRYNIGVYNDRQFIYKQAPTTHDFQRRLTSNEGITDKLGGIVKPWDVTPGKWIFYPDFLAGRIPPMSTATLKTDPRTSYIETVKFTAPWNVSITGEKLGELDQVMAKLGFKGEGA